MNNKTYKKNKTMIRKLFLSLLTLISIALVTQAQEVKRTQPIIWLGVSGGANINMYTGTTQTLNSTLKAPSAFHDGSGVGQFGSLLLELRPTPVWGIMLNLGYDNRGGSFNQVMSPCNCPEDLNTTLSYATVQPSIRIAPFASDFYVFAGGAYSYNLNKSLTYTFNQNNGNQFTSSKAEFSDIRKDLFSVHVGMGYDIQLSALNSRTQVALSPFISYHPYFGQAPRTIESWSLSTVRVGLALKFGTGKVNEVTPQPVPPLVEKTEIVPIIVVAPLTEGDIDFSVRAPLNVTPKRNIDEAFPLRDYVFFDEGSSSIPNRYVKLSKNQAIDFKSEQLRKWDAKDQTGRSKRQLDVYYNILNILGDRMRENPNATITLIGASAGNGAELGKAYAESVKSYLVDVFAIDGTRITTEGRDQPIYPTELPGGKNYLVLLREDDRRVDIVSNSTDMLIPLQIIAEQADPMDNFIVFRAKSKTEVPLKSWTLELTDENGTIQNFGPYTDDQENISGNMILGDRADGNYKVVMVGQTNEGTVIRKESSMHLVHNIAPKEDAQRFSILYDFDKSKTVAEYERFLNQKVAPLIPNYSKVVIHGHTDIIGSEDYNMNLSKERALNTQRILEKALLRDGKVGVTFELLSFGSDVNKAPFENKLPEERFYNRTVIIDIVSPAVK